MFGDKLYEQSLVVISIYTYLAVALFDYTYSRHLYLSCPMETTSKSVVDSSDSFLTFHSK